MRNKNKLCIYSAGNAESFIVFSLRFYFHSEEKSSFLCLGRKRFYWDDMRKTVNIYAPPESFTDAGVDEQSLRAIEWANLSWQRVRGAEWHFRGPSVVVVGRRVGGRTDGHAAGAGQSRIKAALTLTRRELWKCPRAALPAVCVLAPK